MAIGRTLLFKGAVWTVGVFSIGQMLRLATNVVLARLLAPELFGIMQIFYSLRNGVELISDVGISQNIIHDRDSNYPDFYNTAWSLQLIRGGILWIVFCIAAVPFAQFYQAPILTLIMPIAAFSLVLSGLTSTSYSLVRKRMRYRRLALFEISVASIFSIVQIALAYFSPTVWALVFGSLIGTATSAIGSHFLLPDIRHKFFISWRYAARILSFGKWIFVSSIIYFMSANFDRLYLARVIPLELLGIYGIARTLSELLSSGVLHLGYNIIFPFVSSHAHIPRAELHEQLAPIRLKFLLMASVGFSIFAVVADMVVRVLYDQRYHAASWMVPVLIVGAWFGVMSNLNEATLMGLGKPNYSVFANSGRFGILLIGLPLSVAHVGVIGGVLVVAGCDLGRYIPILFGQIRERFSFGKQDIVATFAVFSLMALWEWLRWMAGFGTSFASFPTDVPAIFGIAH